MKGLAVLLLVLATAQATPFQHFFGKYAAVKMLSACFGDKYMIGWTKNFTVANEYCSQQSPETYLADLPLDDYTVEVDPQAADQVLNDDFGADINEENILNYLPPAADYSAFANQPSMVNLQAILSALQGNLTHPILLVPLPYNLLQAVPQGSAQGFAQGQQGLSDFFYRQKRQAEEGQVFDADTINKVYQKIRAKAGNFTCIMKRLRVFNDKFDVNIGYSLSQIKNLKLDAVLTSDLFEAMTDCVRFASCKQLNKRSLMPAAVQRAITYMQCENKQTLAACVKYDLMQQQSKFDVSALGRVQAGSDVDLGDKMLAILWGKFAKDDDPLQ